MTTTDVSIKTICDVSDRSRAIADVESIFFVSAGQQTFAGPQDKAAFRQKWLGLYLDAWPELFLVAVHEAHVVAYLAGTFALPGHDDRLAAHDYYEAFSDVLPTYPAHLHINVAADWRSRQIGGQLVGAFMDICHAAAQPGVHIVTGDAARNTTFYRRNGFCFEQRGLHNGGTYLFMGRLV